MIFGFLLAICLDPYIWTGATTPRWALLAIALPVLCALSAPNNFNVSKLLGLSFIAWAAATLTWTANLWDGLGQFIWLILIAMSFCYGSRLESLERTFQGLALGVTVSSAITMLTPMPSTYIGIIQTNPEGLFGNRNMLAEIAVLTAFGCFAYKRYWFIPGLLPAIFYPPLARGALLAALAGFCAWLWPRSRAAVCLLGCMVLIGLAVTLDLDYRTESILERIQVWQAVWHGVDWQGHGLGSLYTLAPYLSSVWDTAQIRLDHAHNEALEILFELGAIGFALYVAIWLNALRAADDVTRPALVAFLVISSIAFPWHIPTNAFVGALLLGHAVRHGAGLRWLYHDWRSSVRLWPSASRNVLAAEHPGHAMGGKVQSVPGY